MAQEEDEKIKEERGDSGLTVSCTVVEKLLLTSDWEVHGATGQLQ